MGKSEEETSRNRILSAAPIYPDVDRSNTELKGADMRTATNTISASSLLLQQLSPQLYEIDFWLRGGGMALTPKQERFVQEYLVDLNATAAAKRAGYKDPNIGRQLITKNNVSDAIQKAIESRQERTEITQDMVLRETAKLAFFDIRKMFDGNGKPLDISQLDSDTAAALVGLDVQDVTDGDGAYTGYVKKYKMADKLKALELLGKHLGTWEPQEKGPDQEIHEDGLSRSLRELGEKLVSDE